MATKKDSYWIPLADLMTVLMVIFLFLAISYMDAINKKQDEYKEVLLKYDRAKTDLFNELKDAFSQDAPKWNLELNKDLSIKFTNPQVLFAEGSSDIKPEFKTILDKFLPRYLDVVTQDKYRNSIAEIRIEGHTNTKPINKTTDPYIDNMELSQNRARNVLAHLRAHPYFTGLESGKQSRLQYWLTANGLSFGRTVDSLDSLSFLSGKAVDNDKSRRVEFRIVTTSDVVINNAIKKLSK
jgi:outer membrane protein OmpA-like peptidoglycan-associated protein